MRTPCTLPLDSPLGKSVISAVPFVVYKKSKGVRLGEEPARIKLSSAFFGFSPSEPSALSGPRLWRLHFLLRLRPASMMLKWSAIGFL